MSKFLDYTGLSKLVDNIKNYFQPKPYTLHLTLSNDNEVTFTEDANEVYHYLMDNKDNPNIKFSIYDNSREKGLECAANSLTYREDNIEVILEIASEFADDGVQSYLSIRFAIFDDNYDWYINNIERVYDDNWLLTGTGLFTKPKRYYIDLEQNFFQKYYDNSNLNPKEYYFDVKEDMQILYNAFNSFYRGSPIIFDIIEENISSTINNIIPIVRKYDDKSIEASFIINDHNLNEGDTDDLYIRKIALRIYFNGSYDFYKQNPIYDLSLTNIKDSVLFVEQYLTKKGDGTKFLANNGEYKEVEPKKVHCSIWDDGGYYTVNIGDKEYEIIRDSAELYDIFLENIDNLEFELVAGDNITYGIKNVPYQYDIFEDDGMINIYLIGSYNIGGVDDPDVSMVQFTLSVTNDGTEGEAFYHNLVILRNTGDGTKLLADDGEYKEINALHYTGTIKFAYVNEQMHMQVTTDSGFETIADDVKGTFIGLFNDTTGKISYNSGIYKLIMTKDGEKIYVGDCIIEKGDTTTIVIKRVKGSNYYFAKATTLTLEDGEEYYQPNYFDIACIDITDNLQFAKHIVEHNPHKNDDVVEVCADGETLSFSDSNQGFRKIVNEFMEGQRKFCPPRNSQSIFPTICNGGLYYTTVEGIKTRYAEINGNYEDVTISASVIEDYTDEDYGLILDPYLGLAQDNSEGIHKKVVRIINDQDVERCIGVCHTGLTITFLNDVFSTKQDSEGNDIYVLYLKPQQICEITIIKGSVYKFEVTGSFVEHLSSHNINMYANFINGVEDIIEFDSGGGTMSDYYLWLINYFINSGIDIKVKCTAFADTTTENILANRVFTITEIETTDSNEVILKWRCVGEGESQCILLINQSTGLYEFSTI